MASPYKIDKLGNVTDRETGKQLGYLVFDDFTGTAWRAIFSHLPVRPGDLDTDDADDKPRKAPAWDNFITEVGRPPHVEYGFRTKVAAATFLCATREYDRKEFPPPPFARPRRNESGNGWIAGDQVYDSWCEARNGVEPSFEKVDGERWAVHGLAADLTPGTSVEVRKRNGTISTVELAEVVSTRSVFGTTFVTVLVKKTPRKSTGSGGGYRRSSNQRRSRRWCPVCGEERGSGLFDGYRCNECGWHG